MSVQEVQEIVAGSGGVLLVLMTLAQIAPIKINPWSAVGKWIGKVVNKLGQAFNKDVIEELKTIKQAQAATQETLDDHIRMDDERNADLHRVYILRFNRELLQENVPHTREDFVEVLSEIDFYERYCKEHPEYENNRAVLAIQNIKQTYSERLQNHNFA